METVRLAVREAAVSLALEHGQILRDPARRDGPEYADIRERRKAFREYLHDQGVDSRMLEHLIASIPEHAYGPTKPECYDFGGPYPQEAAVHVLPPVEAVETAELISKAA